MGKNILLFIVGIGGGLFSIVASIMDWDWFFNNYRARVFVKIFGRNGARVFYSILGGILFILGIKAFS